MQATPDEVKALIDISTEDARQLTV